MNSIFILIFMIAVVSFVIFISMGFTGRKGERDGLIKRPFKVALNFGIISVVSLVGLIVTNQTISPIEPGRFVAQGNISTGQLTERQKEAEKVTYYLLDEDLYKYTDKFVTYTGKIEDVHEKETYTNILLGAVEEDEDNTLDGNVFVQIYGKTDVIVGEVITVYGEVEGYETYVASVDQYKTSYIPAIAADAIESVTYKDLYMK